MYMKPNNLLPALLGVAVLGSSVQAGAQQSGATNPAQSQGIFGGTATNTANSGIVQRQNLQRQQNLLRQQNLWRTPEGQIIGTNTGALPGQVRQPWSNREWVRQPVPPPARSPYSPAVAAPGAFPILGTGTNTVSSNPQTGQPPVGQPGAPVIQPGRNVTDPGSGTSMVPPGGQTALGQRGTAIGPQGQIGLGQPNTALQPQVGQPPAAMDGTGTRPQVPRPAINSRSWGTTVGARWSDPRFVVPDGMGTGLRQDSPVSNNGNGFRYGGNAGNNVGGAGGSGPTRGSTSGAGAGGGSTGGGGATGGSGAGGGGGGR